MFGYTRLKEIFDWWTRWKKKDKNKEKSSPEIVLIEKLQVFKKGYFFDYSFSVILPDSFLRKSNVIKNDDNNDKETEC